MKEGDIVQSNFNPELKVVVTSIHDDGYLFKGTAIKTGKVGVRTFKYGYHYRNFYVHKFSVITLTKLLEDE